MGIFSSSIWTEKKARGRKMAKGKSSKATMKMKETKAFTAIGSLFVMLPGCGCAWRCGIDTAWFAWRCETRDLVPYRAGPKAKRSFIRDCWDFAKCIFLRYNAFCRFLRFTLLVLESHGLWLSSTFHPLLHYKQENKQLEGKWGTFFLGFPLSSLSLFFCVHVVYQWKPETPKKDSRPQLRPYKPADTGLHTIYYCLTASYLFRIWLCCSSNMPNWDAQIYFLIACNETKCPIK